MAIMLNALTLTVTPHPDGKNDRFIYLVELSFLVFFSLEILTEAGLLGVRDIHIIYGVGGGRGSRIARQFARNCATAHRTSIRWHDDSVSELCLQQCDSVVATDQRSSALIRANERAPPPP